VFARKDRGARLNYLWGVGRRKTSVARVRLAPGNGNILINSLPYNEYFKGLIDGLKAVEASLSSVGLREKYDVFVNVNGGGKMAQADAVKLGIARALAPISDDIKKTLHKNGLLTRDPRMVERKKPGRPKARKSFQWSKR